MTTMETSSFFFFDGKEEVKWDEESVGGGILEEESNERDDERVGAYMFVCVSFELASFSRRAGIDRLRVIVEI